MSQNVRKAAARLGYEASGVVEALGENVIEFKIGDTVVLFRHFRWGSMAFVQNMPWCRYMRL